MAKERNIPLWGKLLLALSGVGTTALMMQTDFAYSYFITLGLSALVMLILALKTSVPGMLLSGGRIWEIILAAVLTWKTVYPAKSAFYTCIKGWLDFLPGILMKLLPWCVMILAVPVVFLAMLWFIHFMSEQAIDFRNKADYMEWFFLLGAGILLTMMLAFSYMCTQAFYGAHINGGWFNFDLVYSADSGYLVKQDVYRNVAAEQNDLRQPLFGLFALPFAHIAGILASVFTFIPEAYITILQVMQIFLLLISLILISRMMDLHGTEKALFLVLMTLSYPTLIFALTAEQYLFAVFYLVLGIYLSGDKVGGSLCFIGATGSMLTSGALFPVFTWDKDFKTFVKNTFVLCLSFFAVTIVSGRLTTILDIPSYIEGYAYYTGADVEPVQKLMQFVNFVGACLVAPASYIDTTTYNHVSWQMLPVNSWRIFGIVFLTMAILGVIVSGKERFSRVCGGWMAFSFLLLGIVGWGTVDNGLMLYSLYFGWAFISMAFRFVEWLLNGLLPKFRVLRYAVMLAALIPVSVINVNALREVLIFATQFYPALR